MKLYRYGESGHEKPGCELNGKRLDVSGFGEDFDRNFFESNGIDRLISWVDDNLPSLAEVDENERFGPPLIDSSKLIGIGLNYKGHATEVGADIPDEPIVFFKSTSAICGPNDDVTIPKGSTKLDWEVEIAFVIGKTAKYVTKEDAMSYVAGYLLHNDYSERAFQIERGGQWVKGKSHDTFAPLGPFLVTRDEIENVHNLDLWLEVNGQQMQKGNTADFIFNIPWLISYLSGFMTLLPGDIVTTGTPAGVGMGMKPQTFLKEGDVVALGVEGLGRSSQRVIKE